MPMPSAIPLIRAKIQEEEKSQKILPANRFAEASGFFGGPSVTIYVGAVDAQKYILPKAHLCSQSRYFRAAFEGGFQESHEQVLHLVDEEPCVFELVIQWLYTGTVITPPTSQSSQGPASKYQRAKASNERNITAYLAFLILCDKLVLHNNYERHIVDKIRACLVAWPNTLKPKHLVAAVKLPSGHLVRKLFAEATVKDFVIAKQKRRPFRFEAQLRELEGYAADLLLACGGIFRNCAARHDIHGEGMYSNPCVISYDPFTRRTFSLAWPGPLSRLGG